ncbi:MAG: class I SAM-dependent methyltransferase [Candidatus Omnitrophica bacterium]|nr:class I SAM-dependent methyltransferase [Candidatus Omnitrophota bacterium]
MSTECTGKLILERADRRLIDCKKCGYMHIFPMYTEEELEHFYENVYSESTPSYIWYEKFHNIQRWKPQGTVLDIGCWEGAQLEIFKEHGWKCTGIELNKKAAATATTRGLEVHQLSIQEFFKKFRGARRWDVINVAYILEHIPKPADFLKKIGAFLKKGGFIIVEVPNEFSPFQIAYLKEHSMSPYWIKLPDHVNYFNKRGLENLMKSTGWKKIHGHTSFPMEMFLLMGDNYLKDNKLGRRSFRKVVEMERILRLYKTGLVSRMYSALYHCGIGRSLVIYAQKKKMR